MAKARGFVERWLQHHDVRPESLSGASTDVRERASRYPFPVNHAWPMFERIADRVGPVLALRKLRSARSLDSTSFEALEHGLQHHPLGVVRALYMLTRYPALERLYPDTVPLDLPPHPLSALEDTIRRDAAHTGGDFDVVVIGSGAGGAPLAWSLSRAGYRVAIVEAGGLMTSETTGGAMERHFLFQGMTGSMIEGGMTLVLAGSAVGGTTVVNSGTSLRPLAECLDGWDREAGTRFGQGQLEPWLDAASAQAGIGVPSRDLLDHSAEIIERGFKAIGRDGFYVLPRNAPGCKGAGRCCFGCPNGAKLSTDRSFLPEAIQAGAILLARTRASTIRETRDGVEVFARGPRGGRTLRARKLVIAAGALGTPYLVRRNRLGSSWKKAGRNLRIHPASKVFAMMPDALPEGGIPQGIGYKPPDLPRVTFEGVHTPASAAAPMIMASGLRHRYWMERYEHLATFGMMVRDRSTGRVHGIGNQRIVRYGVDPEDCRDLGAALLINAEAFFAAGAERILLPLMGLNPEVENMDQLRRFKPEDFTRQRLMTCGFHPQGTCAMGRVVDPDLKVEGSQHISICDASVLPNSPGVNPQVTLMALALRCADHLKEQL